MPHVLAISKQFYLKVEQNDEKKIKLDLLIVYEFYIIML